MSFPLVSFDSSAPSLREAANDAVPRPTEGPQPPWAQWVAPRRHARPMPGAAGRRGWTLAEARLRLAREDEWAPPTVSLGLEQLLRALSHYRANGGVDGAPLGIDLDWRGHEVRKLFFAGGYHRSVLKEGLDPDEALQEVYRGLLIRNRGTCPWDYKKSSFGHYVHIVIRCVLSNYLRKERRRNSREFLATADADGEVKLTDGVTAGTEGGDAWNRRELVAEVMGRGGELETALALVGGLERGLTRRQLAVELGRPLQWVEETVRRLKTLVS